MNIPLSRYLISIAAIKISQIDSFQNVFLFFLLIIHLVTCSCLLCCHYSLRERFCLLVSEGRTSYFCIYIIGLFSCLQQLILFSYCVLYVTAFGGDSNRVTIFGQGTGAEGVNLMMLSEMATGLFSQAIMQVGKMTSFKLSN